MAQTETPEPRKLSWESFVNLYFFSFETPPVPVTPEFYTQDGAELAEMLRATASQVGAEGFNLFINVMMDSPELGTTYAIAYGPTCTASKPFPLGYLMMVKGVPSSMSKCYGYLPIEEVGK